jgi:hypothetical protein
MSNRQPQIQTPRRSTMKDNLSPYPYPDDPVEEWEAYRAEVIACLTPAKRAELEADANSESFVDLVGMVVSTFVTPTRPRGGAILPVPSPHTMAMDCLDMLDRVDDKQRARLAANARRYRSIRTK